MIDIRLLQEEEEGGGTATESSTVLRNTFRVYGSLCLVLVALFCYLRKRFPKAYATRSWVDGIKTKLAKKHDGYFSWIPYVLSVSEDDLLDECSMDMLCFIRILKLGFKMSVFGMINAVILMPVYGTAPTTFGDDGTSDVTDPVASLSTAHVGAGSPRFYATVVSAYMLYIYLMYLFFKEFEWFIIFRHRFLSKPMARNYSVFIRYIPKRYCSKEKLTNIFERLFPNEVLEVNVNRDIPDLQEKVNERDDIITKLEHAIAVRDIKGETPTHRTTPVVGEQVNSIETYSKDLEDLNHEIAGMIEAIEKHPLTGDSRYDPITDGERRVEDLPRRRNSRGLNRAFQTNFNAGDHFDPTYERTPTDENSMKKNIKDFIIAPIQIAQVAVTGAKSLIDDEDDGEAVGSAFVSFSSLRAASMAVQVNLHPTPFSMNTVEAPDPEDVYWKNADQTHKQVESGKALSLGLTTTLIIFWTVIVAFVQSLSSVEGLREDVPFIDTMLDTSPWMEAVLAQIAPLLLIVLNIILVVILMRLSMLEGPISEAVVQAKLFTKMAIFTIVQTFFVSAISGSLLDVLGDILDDPTSIANLLAESLPSKSTFFIQLALINTFLRLPLNLLRVVDIGIAFARKYIGPNLTEKERNKTHMGLRPLADPKYFNYADMQSSVTLYFLIFLVYTVIAPIINFFLGFCFALMIVAYRNQFIYIYPTVPDSGGKLWVSFMKLIPYCMIIGELTIIGLLGTKQAAIPAALMFPLLVITIFFIYYLHQEHFEKAEYLSAMECIIRDEVNEGKISHEFLAGKYVQPELRDKHLEPYNKDGTPDVMDDRSDSNA